MPIPTIETIPANRRVAAVVTPARIPEKSNSWRRPLVAILFVGVAYFLARPESVPLPAVKEFSFAPPIRLPGDGHETVRILHGDYSPNNGWVSSVGAAASLGDLENSGRPDGCISVDPRDNTVRYVRFLPDGNSAQGWRVEIVTELTAPVVGPTGTEESSAPMGSVIGDFDADGWMEVLVYYWGRLPVLFRNPRGSGEWRAQPLTASEMGGNRKLFTNSVCLTDVDGDGMPDLVIGNYFPASAEVLNPYHPSGTQEMQDSMSHAINGGRKFVLLNKSSPGNFQFVSVPIELEDTDGSSLSEKRTKEILNGWTLAIGAADLDGDFLPELYIANDFGPDQLLFNRSEPGRVKFRVTRGAPRFDVPKSKTLGRDSFKGMGVEFTRLDPANAAQAPTILVSNIAEQWALLESHFAFVPTVGDFGAMRAELDQGVAPFRDQSEQLGLSRSGWGWDIKAVDFNNDGFPEIVQALGFLQGDVNKWAYLQELATGNDYHMCHLAAWPFFRTAGPSGTPDASSPGRLFRNSKLSGDSHLAFFARPPGGGAFSEIGAQIGFPDKMVSRGIAVADIDHDGRVDFVLANQWQDSLAYRNLATRAGSYVGLRVLKPAGDRPALPGVYSASDFVKKHWTATWVIGARVILERSSGDVLGSAVVEGSNGHSGHRAAEVHLGVGAIAPSEWLNARVQWCTASSSSHRDKANGWTSYVQKLHAGIPGGSEGWWVIVVGNDADAK